LLATSISLLATAVTALPAAAAPSYTTEERAFAIASPSLVFVENRYSGVVRLAATGEPQLQQSISIAFRCSGTVVDPNSHVVTATHCVRPTAESIRNSAVSQLANEKIKQSQLTAAQKDDWVRENAPLMQFTGASPGSEATQRILAQMFQATSNTTTEPAIEGSVVEALPIAEGDVAVLKFALAGMPVLELSNETIDPAATVVITGYNADSGSSTYLPKSKEARISGRIGTATPAQYQLDGDLGSTASGGMVLDSSGRLLGMVNIDSTSKDRLNRLITSMELIKDLLGKANVSNTMLQTDNNYRAALNDYFGGRYESATKKFDNVISVMPDHVLAKNYRKQAAERLAVEGDSSSGLDTWMWTTVLLGVTQVISVILIIVLLSRRRRAVVTSTTGLGLYSQVSTIPVSSSPISITPISGGPYETYHTFHEGPTRLNPDDFTTSAETEQPPHDPGNPWAPRQ